MDDVLCLQSVALGDLRFAGAAAVQGAALGKQFRSCCPVDSSIHAATAAGRAAKVAVEGRHVLGIARGALAISFFPDAQIRIDVHDTLPANLHQIFKRHNGVAHLQGAEHRVDAVCLTCK